MREILTPCDRGACHRTNAGLVHDAGHSTIDRMADIPLHRALRHAAQAAEAAIACGSPWDASEALVRLGCCYRDAGEAKAAIASFEMALPWARLVGSDATIDVLCTLAECAADLAEALDENDRASGRGRPAREKARAHAREAWALAPHATDRRAELKLLLRICEVHTRFGDHHDAIALQSRAVDLMRGVPSRYDLAVTTGFGPC